MTQRWVVIIKVALWAACLAPLTLLVLQALGYLGGLGANPVEQILNVCGKTGLNLLMLTLCITPIRRATGINRLISFRRLLGLFAFFYLALHFSTYALLDLGLLYAPGQAFGTLLVDIAERPYITVGFTALVLLIPLAVTSTRGMQRRLGQELGETAPARLRRRRARRRALLLASEIRPRLRRAAALRVSSSGAPRRTAQAPTSKRESRRDDGVSGRRATTSRPENRPLALRRRRESPI